MPDIVSNDPLTPRSMPPPAPAPARLQDPQEAALLARYLEEIEREIAPIRHHGRRHLASQLARDHARVLVRRGLVPPTLSPTEVFAEVERRRALAQSQLEQRSLRAARRMVTHAPIRRLLANAPGGPCTMRQIARRAALPVQSVCAVLHGYREPGLRAGIRLARALGIKVSELGRYVDDVMARPIR